MPRSGSTIGNDSDMWEGNCEAELILLTSHDGQEFTFLYGRLSVGLSLGAKVPFCLGNRFPHGYLIDDFFSWIRPQSLSCRWTLVLRWRPPALC